MGHKVDERAITVAVGAFIRQLRGEERKKTSMKRHLEQQGVRSSNRAKQLVDRMIEHKIIIRHRDGSYSLTKENYMMEDIMPILLKREYHRKKITTQSSSLLEKFTPKELADELRNRGYKVTATKPKQVIIMEEL